MGINDELLNRGIKDSSETGQRFINYIGSGVGATFADLSKRLMAQFPILGIDVSSLGDAYQSAYYQQTPGSRHKTYEAIYGDFDWSTVAVAPSTLQILEESFGGADAAPAISDADQASLRQIYGTTSIPNNTRTAPERSTGMINSRDLLRRASDVDTRGIRGIADNDAPINPYA